MWTLMDMLESIHTLIEAQLRYASHQMCQLYKCCTTRGAQSQIEVTAQQSRPGKKGCTSGVQHESTSVMFSLQTINYTNFTCLT